MPKKMVTGRPGRTPRAFVPVLTELRAAGLSNRERRAASLAKCRALRDREAIRNNNEKETA